MALSLSQEDIALETDVTQGSISNYEAGRSDIPFVVLLSLCRALQVDLQDLIPAEPESHEVRDAGVAHHAYGVDDGVVERARRSLSAARGA